MLTLFRRVIAFILSVLAFFGINVNFYFGGTQGELTGGSYIYCGKELEVVLNGNATTGYEWEVSADGESVKILKHEYKPFESHGMVGTGGEEHFYFEAVAEGTSTLVFTYARPFDPDDPNVRTLTLEVTVGADLNIICVTELDIISA